MHVLTAVTTAPRETDYLAATLASLADAGFSDPLVVNDTELTGPWPAFKRTLARLVELAEDDADGLLIFQDDILVSRGLSGWLSGLDMLEITDSLGCLSLYCAKPNHQRFAGLHRRDLSARGYAKAYGACALLLPCCVAVEMLSDNPRPENLTKTDMNVAEWCGNAGYEYWFHSPSLVQHVGADSTLRRGKNTLNDYRVATHFCEDVAELGVAGG